MALSEDLSSQVKNTLRLKWTERSGVVVPSDSSVGLMNDGINLNATVLYADLADSTILVDNYCASFAAEVYKTFLFCAAKIIKSNNGEITAYDGDRIMAVFIGDDDVDLAVKVSMELEWAVNRIIQPAIDRQYQGVDYKIKHVVGIDKSELFIAKTGIRGSNDLVWVGRAANYAAKLSSLSDDFSKYITKEVYLNLSDKYKFSPQGDNMWVPINWNAFDGRLIYRSNWSLEI